MIIEGVSVPEGEAGIHRVERFEIPKESIEGIRLAWQGRGVTPGIYTKLVRGRTLVMSDTPAERRDHYPALHHAEGNVLLGGLGIGMVLQAIAKKETVRHVTVFEKEQEVVDLVWPHYVQLFGDRISVEVCDVMDRKPNKGERYDFAWWDIWDNICADNLPEMQKIRRAWCRRISKQGFWCEYEVKRLRRHDW